MAHVPARERRRQLIAATSRVISHDGVGGATVRRIAEEAGTAPASLHYAFASKEDLFVHVLSSSIETTSGLLDVEEIEPGSGLDLAVEKVLAAFHSPTTIDRESVHAQFELLLWSLRTDVAADAAPRVYRLLTESMVEAFRRAAGPDEQGADLEFLARLTILSCDGILFGMLCTKDDYVTDEDIAVLARGLVRTAAERELST